jgi:hypothetical protein
LTIPDFVGETIVLVLVLVVLKFDFALNDLQCKMWSASGTLPMKNKASSWKSFRETGRGIFII